MENGDFPAFSKAVGRLFALYPGANIGELTVSAWFSELEDYALPVVLEGLRAASKTCPQFCPTAPFVAEHCRSLSKTRLAQGPQNLERRALPEPAPEIDPALRQDFEAIQARVRSGELDGMKAGSEYLRAIAQRLG